MNENDDRQTSLDLSVVLPVFNEQDNVDELHREISAALSGLGIGYEVIYVDDGSRDHTLERLRALQRNDSRIVVIELRRNFGQTAAMSAGFDHARGKVVVTMDADRQNDPKDIPKLLEKVAEGCDLVAGWRFDRQDALVSRKLPSQIANHLISWTTDVKLHDYGCTLKAMKREVAKGIDLYGEMHRFIPAIASWMGVRIAEVKVNHRPRVAGKSKYGISRTFRVILDLITVKFLLSYSSRPLQFFGAIGLVALGLGFLIGLVMTIQRTFFDIALGDRPLLLLSVLLMVIGLQFITTGLVAEMITRTYHESQKKPIYTIREIHRLAA
jgi:glycosyltransferase involved in cell wall biosynthesis